MLRTAIAGCRIGTVILMVVVLQLLSGAISSHAKADEATHLACNDFPPLKIEHPGKNGLPGSDVDLLRELFHRANLPLRITYLPWKRAFAAAQEGSVDGLCSCSYATDRANDFFFSDAIGWVSVGIFTLDASSSSSPRMSDLDSLKVAAMAGRTVGVVGGYALEGDIDSRGIARELATDDTRALDMLIRGRYDYLYSYRAPIEFLAKYPPPSQPQPPRLAYQEVSSNPYYLCLSRKIARNASLLAPLNGALAEMRKDGTIDRILDRYR